MSKEIEEKVVEMRFDNEHFEKNVQTSMSTLDKFKQKLQFKNAGKSFEDIDKAAKKTDLSPLAKSADKVGLRFNAMYTVADQAFRNITNSAMAAGKRIVNALTIDPVKTGLTEYETKMNAVQVIQANTRGKDTMEDITAALEELNTYADKTIYNFAQMTSNVGKFTAQGFRAKEAATAVKGLANLAAASGASAEDMARATYQMSQALGGTIRMIDWNSLRNANMATVDLKNTLMDLARVNGIAIDDMIAKHGTFEQTLQEGWLTGKMFSEAMNIYSGIYSEAELKAKGFTDKQIANFMDLSKMAESAATEVKTFTQLFDVLKETAQSGWTQTWEIVFGDFDTAKKMFTELQVYFSDILNAFSDARNMLLGGALNLKNPWSKIYEKLEASSIGKIAKTFDKVSTSIKDTNDKLEYFQKIVNDVWRGDYKTSDTGRYEMLEAAGYNHKVVQDLVNKGYNYKLTIEDIEESHKKFGLTLDGNAEALKESGEAAEVTSVKFKEITDEQLKQAGLTKDEIKLYRALADEAERTGVTMLHLVKEMSENDGRTMLIDSFKNAWSGLVTVITAVKDAWVDVFPPMTVVQLYNIIKGVKEFSEHLVVHEKIAEKLTRTFKGLFAILDIILTLVSLPVKIAFKLLTSLLSVLNIDILSVTAVIGDAIVGFRDWIDACLDFTGVWKKIIPPIKKAIKAFKGWIEALKGSKNLPQDIAKGIISWFKKAFDTVKGWFGNLGSLLQNGFSGASNNVIAGLVQGLWNGLKIAGQVIVELGKTLIDKFCEILGIHSPSTVFIAIGGFIAAGLLIGVEGLLPTLLEFISTVATKCVEFVKSMDLGNIISTVTTIATTVALTKIANAVRNFSNVFAGLDDMLVDVGVGVKRALTGFKRALSGIGASFRAKAVKDVAIALLILAGALVVLSFVPTDRLIAATGAIAVLGGVLAILFAVISSSMKGLTWKEALGQVVPMILTMVGIAASMLILAKSLSTISEIDFKENWHSILAGIVSIAAMMGLVMLELIATTKFIKGVDFGKLALTVAAIAGLMLAMAIVMKILGGLAPEEFAKGLALVTSFGAIAAALTIMSVKNDKQKVAQTGSLIKRIGEAMLFMAIACKIIGSMSWGEIGKAAVGVVGFAAIIAGLIAITKIGTERDVMNVGKVLSGAGIAILLMAMAGKIINTMTWSEMWQAMIGIAALSAIIAGLILATRMASGKDLAKVGTTLLMISVSIGVLALIASLLSFMDTEALKKGVGAVSALGLIMAALVLATGVAKNCLGNLIVMTIAIALMASAVTMLSLIDTTNLLKSTGSMVAMMGMFALMIASTKFINAKAMGSLIILTAIVGVLYLITIGLSKIDGEKALASTLSLITLMGAMTALMFVLTLMKPDMIGNAVLGGLGLCAMLVPLTLFGVALAALPSFAGKEKDILILVGVMTVMTALLVVTAAVGAIYIATSGIAATGLIGLAAMMLLLIGFGASLEEVSKFTYNEETIDKLVGVMTSMADLLVKVSILGPLTLMGVSALKTLLVFMAQLSIVGLALTTLNIWGHLDKFVDVGIPVLEKLAHGLGSIVSNFVTGLLSGIPKLGTLLTDFMDNAKGFVTGIKKVDGEVLKGVLILVTSFKKIASMDTSATIRSFFHGGESPFASFSEGLTELADCILDFAESLGSFGKDKLEAVKRGAEAIKVVAAAAKSIPNSGGWAGAIMGENDLDDFIKIAMGTDKKKGIKDLIECLASIKFDDETLSRVKTIAKIITALAEAAATIPNSGGWAGVFAGNNDLDDFIKMATGDPENDTAGVKDLINSLKGIKVDDTQLEKIDAIVGIVLKLAEAAATIPNSGGEVSFWAGDNRIDDFMLMIMGDGENYGIKALMDCLSEIELNDADKIKDIAAIMVDLANAAAAIPDTGVFSGNDSIKKFIQMLVDSMENLEEFLSSAGDLEYSDEVSNIVTLIQDVTAINNNIGKNSGKNLKSFSKNLVTFANKFKDFCDKMSKIKADTVSASISKMKELIDVCQSFSKNSADNLSALGKALKDVAAGGISKFTKEFSKNASVDSAKKAINKFIKTTADKVKTKSNKKKFTAVGKYLVEGIAEGIKNNKSLVTEAMAGVIEAAEAAAKKSGKINSPSKVFIPIGSAVDEGLAKGIDDNTDIVDESVTNMVNGVVKTAQDELDINSPSLVFKKDVGRWICEGITEGIKEDTSAEEAIRIKMGNLYGAYLELKKNWKGESPLPDFSDFARENGFVFDRVRLEKDAKAASMSLKDYIEHAYAEAYLDVQKGKPIANENAVEAIGALYEKDFEEIEAEKKRNESEHKWSKIGSALGFTDKVEKDKAFWNKQIELNSRALELYKQQILDYGAATDAMTDEAIADIRTKMIALEEENAEYRKNLANAEAEAAAAEAENISEKYAETLNRIKRDLEMLDLTYANLVMNTKDSSQAIKHRNLYEHLDAELKLLKEQEETYRTKFNEIAKRSKSDSEEYIAAFREWVEAKEDRVNKEQEITDTREQHLQELEEADDRVRESEYALWKSRHKDATEQEALARELQYLNASLKDAEEESAKIYEEYLKILEKEEKDSEAAKTALANWNESVKKELDLRNQIADNKQASIDAAEAARDRVRDSEYELWVSENENASDRAKLTKELSYIDESIVDALEDVKKAEEDYNKSLQSLSGDATEQNNLLADLNEKKKIVADLQKQKNDTQENILALVDEERSIASEVAKLKYDIWEKTEGRDAKDEEKELKQLEYLNNQLLIQNHFTNEALREYNAAVSDPTKDSVEIARAYKSYLNELHSAAELKNQILDLEESAADRQKRLKDKQDLAQTEYEDYIKKYEKYYSKNGMSSADLERDAKLVSGYDPGKVVNNITSRTKTALESITTSVSYQSILTGFTDMGISYVQALNEGAGSQTDTIINTTTEMVKQCVAEMLKKRPLWIEAGKYLVEGLVKGIKDERSYAINSVMRIAKDMIAAAKTELDIHSPSKAFAEIGRYSILGLVKGLVDNSGLSDDAAAHIGDSAIESLKNSIRQISDVVNSDLDTQPTIRPVLDLSNIRSGTARLNAMVSNAQAIAISDSRKARERYDENQNGNESSTNKGNTYQFTQNNYSPKALSRTEIYRQTKNQFAAMKEVLT